MFVDQHLFGKKEMNDFSTLDLTLPIKKEDLEFLEGRSCYNISPELICKTGIIPHPKYVYYKLNEYILVLGRGIVVGQEKGGWKDDYLFHNLIIALEDLKSKSLNPSKLMNYLEANDYFKSDSLLDQPLKKFQIEVEEEAKNEVILPYPWKLLFQEKDDLLALLIYTCLRSNISEPVQLIGEEDQKHDFIITLFDILPKQYFADISFNTYFNEEKYFYLLCGFTDEAQTCKYPEFSLRINLYNGEYSTQIKNIDRDIFLYAQKLAAVALDNNNEDLVILHEIAQSTSPAEWKETLDSHINHYSDATSALLGIQHDKILTAIATGNIELFCKVRHYLHPDDFYVIYRSENFLSSLLNHNEDNLQRSFIDWYCLSCEVDERKTYSEIIIQNKTFSKLLTESVEENIPKIDAIAQLEQELLEILYFQYQTIIAVNEKAEERMLKIACELALSRPGRNQMTPIIKEIFTLPLPDSKRVAMFRALYLYINGHPQLLINLIDDLYYREFLIRALLDGLN